VPRIPPWLASWSWLPPIWAICLVFLGFKNNENKVKICRILYISQICAWETFHCHFRSEWKFNSSLDPINVTYHNQLNIAHGYFSLNYLWIIQILRINVKNECWLKICQIKDKYTYSVRKYILTRSYMIRKIVECLTQLRG
jgi:hypothetical protein